MIVIVDYGLGNVASIQNMLRKIGFESIISNNKKDIVNATKLILPGVGSFDKGVINLKEKKLWDILNTRVIEAKTPILGICLGMQLMTKYSDEGKLNGFGWLDAQTIKFDFSKQKDFKLKIPHMGWNLLTIKNKESLYCDWNSEARFYFVHSYHVICNKLDNITATAFHGHDITASFHKDNIYGVQFHPEKSHKFGMKLLKAFAEI